MSQVKVQTKIRNYMFTNRNLIGIRKKSSARNKRKLIGKIDPELEKLYLENTLF